jgi:Tol biopolymer transport system component
MRHVAASRIGISVVLTAALLVAALVLAGSGGATFPGRDGRIVFAKAHTVNSAGGYTDLYSLDLAGRQSRNLSGSGTPGLVDSQFALSPDGTQIAFLRTPPQPFSRLEWHLWLMRVDGSDQHQLADIDVSAIPGSLAWSPDGTTIAFVAPASAAAPLHYDDVLWVVNADGGGLHELTDVEAAYPRWSPDGSEIAFAGTYEAHGHTERSRIGVVGATGAGLRWLTGSFDCDSPNLGVCSTTSAPAWSPDGKALVFARGNSLVLIGADGSGERTLTTGIANGYLDACPLLCDLAVASLQWSPRSDEISFVDKAGNVRLIRPDGSGLQTIVCHASPRAAVAWSPTGDRLAFVRELGPAFQLAIEPLHGPAKILPLPSGYVLPVGPAWLPSGESVLYAASLRGSRLKLFSIRSHGGGRRQLTHDNLDDFDPIWSPDGRRIAFARGDVSEGFSAIERSLHPDSVQRSSLYLMGAYGSHVRRLTRSGVDTMPSWSADGGHIVLARRHGLSFDIAIVATRTGRIRPLTSGASDPAWSPDGRLIAFAKANTLQVIRPDGVGERTLFRGGTSRSARIFHPAWSPDGRSVAFTLVLMRSDGTLASQRQLTVSRMGGAPRALPCLPLYSNGDIARIVTWSPVGDSIGVSDGGAIWTCPANGSSTRLLSGGDEPDWQPLR